ncbi:MAG: hypothetical protein HQL52_11830 [Magnetococcales bacterium]|nr:hypothetical protein [Magnetococcales bacterium]
MSKAEKKPDRLTAMLDLVEAERVARCEEILAEARQEAAQITRAAHREARDRMHKVVREERERESRALKSARAQQETEFRQHRLQVANTLIKKGRVLLGTELQRRWEDPRARGRWVGHLVKQATTHLPPGPWRVRHPQGWESGELRRGGAVGDNKDGGERVTQEVGETTRFEVDATLSAGLCICSGGTCIDGSAEGLQADRGAIDARLLALLETTGGQT